MSSSSALAFNSADLSEDRGFNPRASAVVRAGRDRLRNHVDMLAADVQFAGDSSEDPLVFECQAKLPPRRVIVTRDLVTGHTCTYISQRIEAVKTKTQLAGGGVPSHGFGDQIRKLRERQKLTQTQLARELGVSQVSVSRWEAGIDRPSAENFIQLGRLAGQPYAWEFWELAGLRREDLAVVPKPEQETHGRKKHAPNVVDKESPQAILSSGDEDVIPIPFLTDRAAAGSPRHMSAAKAQEVFMVSRSMVPHPESTVSFQVSGDSMSPVLEDGYTVIVDTHTVERRQLYGQMVAARDPEGGVTIKWLRKVGREEVLVAQHTSTRYQPVILSSEPGWRIIGRVLFWIGKPT